MREEIISLQQAVRQSTNGVAGDEGPICDAPLIDGWCNSTTPGSHTTFTSPSSPRPSLTLPSHHTGRRKLVEFDGSVAWEAYQAQFQMLADAMDWDEAEHCLQLVSCLRGPAVEVLGHLSAKEQASYPCYEEEAVRPCHDFRTLRTQREKPSAAKPVGVKRTRAGEFQGSCWGCAVSRYLSLFFQTVDTIDLGTPIYTATTL
ncbi:hypothetical protein E2C01_026707 [Portunus trituberculatus]|uniref:Uncharacterized protein n=1 Tax=Portunus trituberculatus TaxID=210409 RepID=A0A5B7EJC6_PORTR|nr:hypothetical protein [Portunus trituberculatus]